jgi:hypothetical protein
MSVIAHALSAAYIPRLCWAGVIAGCRAYQLSSTASQGFRYVKYDQWSRVVEVGVGLDLVGEQPVVLVQRPDLPLVSTHGLE